MRSFTVRVDSNSPKRRYVGAGALSLLNRAALNAANLLYPPVCPICMNIAECGGEKGAICSGCRKRLRYIHNPRCLKCGKQLSSDETEYCFDCAGGRHIFKQCVGVWDYTDEIRKSIYEFKYHNQRAFARIYAKELLENCGNIMLEWNAQALVPVPLHSARLKKRGYNQAELVAEHLGKELGMPVDTEMLVRVRQTKPQKELNDRERLKNLENAFIINKNGVKYKKVILVDDIYTTGATIDACAAALMSCGVREVYCAALCIGRGF